MGHTDNLQGDRDPAWTSEATQRALHETSSRKTATRPLWCLPAVRFLVPRRDSTRPEHRPHAQKMRRAGGFAAKPVDHSAEHVAQAAHQASALKNPTSATVTHSHARTAQKLGQRAHR